MYQLTINFAYRSGTNGYWSLDGKDKVIKTLKKKDYNYPIPREHSIIKLYVDDKWKHYLVTDVNYEYGDDYDQVHCDNVYINVYLIYIP